MDINTGELRRYGLITDDFPPENFKKIPKKFQEEAERELAGQNQAFVNMEESSPLADWAKHNRPHPDGNRKQRRRMAKEARRKNRG